MKPQMNRRVLACDPGFERLGIAVLEKQSGKETVLHSDCLRTSPSISFPKRLAQLGADIETLIATWQPSCMALEDIFFEKNAKTAMGVAQVRGMLAYIAGAIQRSASYSKDEFETFISQTEFKDYEIKDTDMGFSIYLKK